MSETQMVMRLSHPVRDHLDKPVHAFHSHHRDGSRDASWQMHGPFYIVMVERNTPNGRVQDTHTIPALWCAVSIYNVDTAKLAEEQARRQEAAREILEMPDEPQGELQ